MVVGLIWYVGVRFAAPFGGRMHVSKVYLFDFEISCFLGSLVAVSDLLVLYFDTNFSFLFHFEMIRKTRSAKPGNLAVGFRLDLLWDPIGDKNVAMH